MQGSKVWSSKMRSSKIHFLVGVQKCRVQKSGVQKCRVQKFIFYLEFKNAGFKSLEFKNVEFKNSFSTWGSETQGSKVTGSKMQSSKIWSSKIHSCLRVQKSGVQRFRVQKFMSYLEFKNSGFKYLGSKLRVQISWVQIFMSRPKVPKISSAEL